VASQVANALSLLIASLLVVSAVPVFSAPSALAAPEASGVAKAAPVAPGYSCVSNGFLTAEVDNPTGLYTFSIGGCSASGNVADHILYSLGTSFVTVADFTTGVDYTEGGDGRGVSLGAPLSSSVDGRSIVAVFHPTADGLTVTQNITVAGGNYSNSYILMNVKVVNTNANPQVVGVRYLWDAQVGGYDGTWLREYDGTTEGIITGYETDFNPPPSNFTSYAMGGCSLGTVTPPPYRCDPSDFGAGAGSFSVLGSISAGPGATTPSRFVYGWWGAMFKTAYGYASNPSDEVGSYLPNVGGTQDSAMLYYFSNETLQAAGGAVSEQADITNLPGAVPIFGASIFLSPSSGAVRTAVTVTGTRLAPFRNVTLTSFGRLGPVPLRGKCTTDASGNLTSSKDCTFLVPASAPVGTYTLTFSDGTNNPTTTFLVTLSGLATTVLNVTCSASEIVVGSTTTCEATLHGSGTPPTGIVSWSSSNLGVFPGGSCKLSPQGSSSECSVKFTPTASGSPVVLSATYGGDSKNSPSEGDYSMTVAPATSTTSVSCSPASVLAGSSVTITCTARVRGYLPTGIVTWSQSGSGAVFLVDGSCVLSKSVYWYITYSPYLDLHVVQLAMCSVTLIGTQAGGVAVLATYGGDSGNLPSSGRAGVTIRKLTTTLSVACPSSLSVGQPGTCTATVHGGSSPTGTVTWSKVSGSGSITFSSKTCTLSSGSCSVTVTATTAGSVKIRAAYGGDSDNLKSSGTLVLTLA
jgi:hypothetical protein